MEETPDIDCLCNHPGCEGQNVLEDFVADGRRLIRSKKGHAMSFGLYAAGYAIVIAGLVYAAYLMHVPAHWIVVGAIVLLGMGIVTGVKNTRQKILRASTVLRSRENRQRSARLRERADRGRFVNGTI